MIQEKQLLSISRSWYAVLCLWFHNIIYGRAAARKGLPLDYILPSSFVQKLFVKLKPTSLIWTGNLKYMLFIHLFIEKVCLWPSRHRKFSVCIHYKCILHLYSIHFSNNSLSHQTIMKSVVIHRYCSWLWYKLLVCSLKIRYLRPAVLYSLRVKWHYERSLKQMIYSNLFLKEIKGEMALWARCSGCNSMYSKKKW